MFADALRFFLLRDLSSRHFDYTASKRRLMYLVVVVLTGVFSALTDNSESVAKLQDGLKSTFSGLPWAAQLTNAGWNLINRLFMVMLNIVVNLLAVQLLAWLIDSSVRTHRDWNPEIRIDNAVLCSAFIAASILIAGQAAYLALASSSRAPMQDTTFFLLYAGTASLIGLWRVLRPIGSGRAAWILVRSYLTCVLILLIALAAMTFCSLWLVSQFKP